MDYTTKVKKSKRSAVKNITISYPWAHNHKTTRQCLAPKTKKHPIGWFSFWVV
jgi:hypothetical protein